MPNSGRKQSGTRGLWFIGGAVVVALAIVGYLGLSPWPPVDEDATGAIGAAKRHIQDQIGEEDVVLAETDVHAFMQTEVFQKMVDDPDFRALVTAGVFNRLTAEPAGRNLSAGDIYNRLSEDETFRRLGEDSMRRLSEDMARRLEAPANRLSAGDIYNRLSEDETFRRLGEDSMRRLSEDMARRLEAPVRQLGAIELVNRLESPGARFSAEQLDAARRLAENESFRRVIDQPAFWRLAQSGDLQRALINR